MSTTKLLTASALALTLLGTPYAMAATDTGEHTAHHPEEGSATEQPASPLAAKMQAMRDQVTAIREAEDPEARERLLDEHMASLEQMQSMMQGMMGQGGGMMMGPGMMGGKPGGMMGPGMMGGKPGGMMGPGMMGRKPGGMMGPGTMMSRSGRAYGDRPCPMMDPGMGQGMGMASPERRMDMMERRLDMMQTMMEQMERMMQQGGYGGRY